MLGQAPNIIYKSVWILLLTGCLCMFILQAASLLIKYQRMDKITDIQLKFDTAPFPAITLCNLNPYMHSLVQDVEKIRVILSVYKDAMNNAARLNDKSGGKNEDYDEEEETTTQKRTKRSDNSNFEPALSVCSCEDNEDCLANTTAIPEEITHDSTMCICSFDRESEDTWPCYSQEDWYNTTCQCNEHSYCSKESKDGGDTNTQCLCQNNDPFCVGHEHEKPLLQLWEYFGRRNSKEWADLVNALGFDGLTDEVAIVTKAKENIIFAMGELAEDMRRNVSIQKHELIQKCSFNGKPCDIENDFKIILDPTFGNCFTFNHNKSELKSSIRAGPMYGLRVLMYIAADDYLPTTEAVGIRMTIHDKDDFPFPDTFGYSAPTGYISSFGMNMKAMSRLSAPYGDCIPDGKTDSYIYEDYAYSTEGCYRTCFQDMVIDQCGCGDPRFPVLGNASHCFVFNQTQRECLEQRTKDLGNIHSSFKCRCQQPCKQKVFTVSYSEAIWPSQSLNITLGTCKLEPDECNEHYQENGAMIEVFYEALNFEVLSESEAYGIIKMMADLGGQLGLWSGISVITCCEFVCLFFELMYMVLMHHYTAYKRRLWEQSRNEPW
ncbi:hypothetical protein PFISCL1PPCAC_27095 [Pristionchus fissidentatus]|uniref:Uncharacterized protein n=1 Tax=Pristionchus fissidentatus TaxID=1538716 RepID=A0AAV5WYM6_9BILA|nr:hypothetical protein PFISCL1PPCAC_27095 [Pristionchus fissidentatus]